MARSIWTGVISFGMVAIPVKLYTATESKDISFHQLHKDCNSRLKQLRWCPVHEQAVEYDDVVRGYEFTKGQHVVLTDEDFERLPLPSKHTIEISAFVKAEDIDPLFYERSYYVEPEETGLKPYALFARALTSRGLTALAKIALRNRERLCSVRPQEEVLVLSTLLYADEVRAENRPQVPEVLVSDKELEIAYTLLDVLSDDFHPENFHDDYRAALMEVIEAKLQGQEIAELPAPAAPRVVDLMEALRASVDQARKQKQAAAG